MSFDYKTFRAKYDDPQMIYFNELLIEVKELFSKTLPLLEKSFVENNKSEWKRLKKALLMVGKCMYIPKLYKIGSCSLEEYERIEEILLSIIELEL